ncbi:MAG: hypothetical protein A2Y17_06185 [Clostridiales bacterium GWF2_38_85]|nr:MAG: hypothetical protein A2Y17_06185 [Clostridiales bacterium GWF2_38_85]HBL85480.1 DUF2809 domain-containing protein [Clostridiales bacterium]
MKKRILYSIAFIVLVYVEALTALFVHDSIIRPYGGDVIVVIVLYCFIRIFIPEKVKLLPLYIFLFAVAVEFAQYFEYVKLLGFQDNKFMRVLLGTSFSWYDILSYAIGCVVLVGIEMLRHRITKHNHNSI